METAHYKLTVGNVRGELPLLMLIDPTELPEQYRYEETSVKADTDAIRRDLDNGITIEGCALGDRKRTVKIS